MKKCCFAESCRTVNSQREIDEVVPCLMQINKYIPIVNKYKLFVRT